MNQTKFFMDAAVKVCTTGGHIQGLRSEFAQSSGNIDAPFFLPSGSTKEVQARFSAVTNIKRD